MADLRFVWSDRLAPEAAATFREHKGRIGARLRNVEIRHTGGTSVAGVLTSGDVDLQVRVARELFARARDVLSELYEPLYPEAWGADSAYFTEADSHPPVEVALTVIGTLDDLRHGDAWRRLAADPALVDEYNALKRAHEGRTTEDYNAAKRKFFANLYAAPKARKT